MAMTTFPMKTCGAGPTGPTCPKVGSVHALMRLGGLPGNVGTRRVAGGGVFARPFVHGLSFVIRAAEMQGRVRRSPHCTRGRFRRRGSRFRPARGSIAPHYAPAGFASAPNIAPGSGLHPSASPNRALVRLARQLSASGLSHQPDIPELSQFEIPRHYRCDRTERHLARYASGLAPDHRVGMMGISFSGGLSIVAAGRPSLTDRVAYVFSSGGHDDLTRVLRYLCTGTAPFPHQPVRLAQDTSDAQFTRPPHDYGLP